MIKLKKKIRMSEKDLAALDRLFRKHFLQKDKLWIFGSRVDFTQQGGDIDLYIETNSRDIDEVIKMKTNFIWNLEQNIGEQKIDIVVNILYLKEELPVYSVAKNEGVNIV